MKTRTILWAASVIFGLLAFDSQHAANAAGEATEQQIERVTTEIPPAVIIDGESVKNTTLMDRMAQLHVPGISIAVIHGGKLEWARGFGVRRADGDPVTAATLFQAASISKPITALAALRLVDAGRISLDANVNDYLKMWKVPDNAFTAKQKVTLRELLSHTAGMTVGGFGGYGRPPLPSLRQILDGRPPADNAPIRVDTVPGTIWRYSGGGYVVVRQLLEDVTGIPFGSLLEQSVFEPIGMSHSTFEQPLSPLHVAQAASPHGRYGHPLGLTIYPELAPDGLWTTPSDLAQYLIEVQRALAGDHGSLTTPQTARLMLMPVLNHYGLGVIAGDDPDHSWFCFSGGNYGFPSMFVGYGGGDGAVIMSNGQNGFKLGVDLLRSIAQEYDWPDFKPVRHRTTSVGTKTLDRYVGAYRISPDGFAVVTRDGTGLFLQTSSLGRQPMYPLSAREFVVKQGVPDVRNRIDELKIGFELDAHRNTEGLLFEQSGSASPAPAMRIDTADAGAIIKRMARITERFDTQRPAPGGQTVLLQLLAELADGTTRYAYVTPGFADQLRSIVALNRHLFSRLGPVVSIVFRDASPVGIDTYHVVFRNGAGDMDVMIGAEGKLQDAAYQPE